ncbi:MAG TPA: TPM domain-containing protein, partial [Gemmatimonadales bacterium]|nr:TPM domain-containing protein [Gemmatimonadales bacterium]
MAKPILLLAALKAAAGPALAQGPEVSALFPAGPSGYVTDMARVLDPATAARITERAERLRQATGAEIAVAILPSIGDRAPVDVAVAIGRAWGVGARAEVGDPRRNAGIIVLLVPRRPGDPNSGHIFIASGQGVEGYVTDLQTGRVRDLMIPYFRDGNYGAGLEAGVGELAALVARGMGVTDTSLVPPRRGPAPGLRVLTVILVAALFVLLIAVAIRQGGGSGPGTRVGRSRRRSSPIFWGGWGGGGGGGGFGGFG